MIVRVVALSVALSACISAHGGEFQVREQTDEEAIRRKSSADMVVMEHARDYSAYVGKTLAGLGASGDLVVAQDDPRPTQASVRPPDAAIQSAVRDYRLALFPMSASYGKHHFGRDVIGKLKDGTEFKIHFIKSVPTEVCVQINTLTVAYFRLEKLSPLR